VLAEYPHLETLLTDSDRITIEIREPIATYSDPSKPCIMVSAHQSNWEVACSAMAKMGMPNASLYSPPTNPLLDQLLLDSRQALNCQLLPRDNSARLLMRALKEGRTVGMVMDRRVDDGKPIRFFGYDKTSTILPAKLALKNHCDLVPIQIVRRVDARYHVIFHPPVHPRNPEADETAQAIDMIQQVHEQFEDWIRQHPADWFCSKRLWPKNPVLHKPEVTGSDADIDSYAA
jgi:KDO2-lipid IV(A) lauroyltransferase